MVTLLVALRLAAAALRWDFSPFGYLPLPRDPGVRGVCLLGAAAVLLVLVWLVARHSEISLWLVTPDGGVAVPGPALERVAEREAAADADVVSARAVVRVSRGGLVADVRVFGRPFADGSRLGDEAATRIRRALADATGLADVRVKARPRILAVRELARHLP